MATQRSLRTFFRLSCQCSNLTPSQTRVYLSCGPLYKSPVGISSPPRLAKIAGSLFPGNTFVICRQLHGASPSPSPIRQQKSKSQKEQEDEGRPTLVYHGALSHQIKMLKLFSFATSLCGLTAQSVILNESERSVAVTMALVGGIGFFTFVTPVLIHLMAKRYVADIYFNPMTQQYCAITYNFFLQKNEITFRTKDVTVPPVPGLFTSILVNPNDSRDASSKAASSAAPDKKKLVPLFIALESFLNPNHYGLIMGYDKPLDLHITADDVQALVAKRKEDKAKN